MVPEANSAGGRGLVLEIQRMSTEDGPGLRTTVFFKGCGLRCGWCHNPESLLPRPETQWVGSRCIGCGECRDVCPRQALGRDSGGLITVDRDRCDGCGSCAAVCPSGALETLGRWWTAEDLAGELAKDEPYFRRSGGGVTASGGEAALQHRFVAGLFERLAASGVERALDSSGHHPVEAFESLLPLTGLLLFDIKETDPVRHRELTGHGLKLVQASLDYAASSMRRTGRPEALWIRTPVVPGATADAATIGRIGRFIAGRLDGLASRWDLCAFNHLGRDKYRRLGMPYRYAGEPLLSAVELERLAGVARRSGVDPGIVRCSGPTRLEDERAAGGEVR